MRAWCEELIEEKAGLQTHIRALEGQQAQASPMPSSLCVLSYRTVYSALRTACSNHHAMATMLGMR